MALGLNIDLKGKDTKFPSVSPGEYKAKITEVTGDESKNTPGLFLLKVSLELEEPATSTEGKPIAPGHKMTANISLPSDLDPDNKDIRERTTAAFIDAALGSTKENRPALNDELLPTFAGKVVKIGVAMRKKKEGEDSSLYGDTQISYFKQAVQAA